MVLASISKAVRIGTLAALCAGLMSLCPDPVRPRGASRRRRSPPCSTPMRPSSRRRPLPSSTSTCARACDFLSPFANDPFFQHFFGQGFGLPRERIQSSLGSGVIISPDGVIVTNTHVVKGGKDTKIRVALADKREFDARVVAQDDKTDLAVLKIEGGSGNFPSLQFANSDALEVGDIVLAIGNPFGVGQTVTSGIISALTRTEMAQSDSQVFIQTDAAINPGNSGGALIDMAGKLVGINTMIFSQSGGSVGIGFAIPSNLVRLFADNAMAGRKIERPWIGAQLETVTREMAKNLGLERISGAVVVRLTNNGPAQKAGLQLGDVIVAVDEFDVGDAHSVHYRMTTRGIGNTTRLRVIRKRKAIEIAVPLVPRPSPAPTTCATCRAITPSTARASRTSCRASPTSSICTETDGVVIVAVRSGGIAARLGFQPGDVILQVGDTKITDVVTLDKITREPQRVWRVSISAAAA